MIILTTSTDTQTIRIIPRDYPIQVTLRLRDESTNEVIEYIIGGAVNVWNVIPTIWQLTNFNWNSPPDGLFNDNGYLIIPNRYNLKENRFYELTILDYSGVIYKDKIFCTDQEVDSYSVNDGVYETEKSYDNEYIII